MRFWIIDSTENQSWVQLLNKWAYEVTSSLSSFLLITQHMCQLIPLFPNHSDCFSRNFICVNFIAQSNIINTSFSCRESKMFCLLCSWFCARIICAFHSLILTSAMSASYRRSSSFSLSFILEEYSEMEHWISWNTFFSESQSRHAWSCSWLQSAW